MRARWVDRLLVALGLGDVATGLLLVTVPGATLALIGLEPIDRAAEILLRWVGTFVFAIGVAYLLPYRHAGRERAARLRGAVSFTAIARLSVAAFVALAVIAGELGPGWCLVGTYDGVVALAQLALATRGALGEPD